ncbi:hypothetical protein WH47_07808, partial [Habropoda laboriosa]
RRLLTGQRSLGASPLVCAEVLLARLWEVLSGKNVLVAEALYQAEAAFAVRRHGIQVKCNHFRIGTPTAHFESTSVLRASGRSSRFRQDFKRRHFEKNRLNHLLRIPYLTTISSNVAIFTFVEFD